MIDEFGVDPTVPSRPADRTSGDAGGRTCAAMTSNQLTRDVLVARSLGKPEL